LTLIVPELAQNHRGGKKYTRKNNRVAIHNSQADMEGIYMQIILKAIMSTHGSTQLF